MPAALLDDFRDVTGWRAFTSGEATLALAHEQSPGQEAALRLDFDFKGGAGFVVARKSLQLSLPDTWTLSLSVCGTAPPNKLEVKLVAPDDRNVWWWRREAFDPPSTPTALRIPSREVAFAWGPAGGGTPREIGAIEIAIVAPPGGRGTLRLARIELEDRTLTRAPQVTASSTAEGRVPAAVLDLDAPDEWRSAPGSTAQWLELDFGQTHEYGGLVVDWGSNATPSAFAVQTCGDDARWQTVWSARGVEGERTYVGLPGAWRSQQLRLLLQEPAVGADGFAVRALDVRPPDFSRSPADFLHAVAACERRGLYPRWLYREQSYWTPVSWEGRSSAALLDEAGRIEPDFASFSIEPLLFVDEELLTWADGEREVALAGGSLPVPSTRWRARELSLTTSAFATVHDALPAIGCRYEIRNEGRAPRTVRFFAAVRPLQVTPPWQSSGGIAGGLAPIHALAWRDGAVEVDGVRRLVPLTPAEGFGAATFVQGSVTRHLDRGALPPRATVRDESGLASGALAWGIRLAAGETRTIELVALLQPREVLAPVGRSSHDVPATIPDAVAWWRTKLGRLRVTLDSAPLEAVEALRTAVAHVLVNRDGAALQPGPRRYARSWIRDAAVMAAALSRMGCVAEVEDFLSWYVQHQRADGSVPCVVDRTGPDALVEHDSHGQLAATLADHARFAGDEATAVRWWPHARRAVAYLESLRAERCTPEYRDGDRRSRYGLLPESVSHEGYLAQPVHSYWDDFWALRGIDDSIHLARRTGDAEAAARLAALRDELAESIAESVATVIAARGIEHVPASVEWADLDPAATALAVCTSWGERCLPAAELRHTFDAYMSRLRDRVRADTDWNNYSAYEVRIAAALVRLGRREDAHEVLDFILGDRRPRAWNQWPEISWRDPRSPGHLGDLPHAWIGAEYALAVMTMLAYEDSAEESLVIAAGVPERWLEHGALCVAGLGTWWGELGYRLRRVDAHTLEIELDGGLEVPPGGIVLRPPVRNPLRAVEVDGTPTKDFLPDRVRLGQPPARVILHS
jgi:hypothetical protein